MDGKLSTLDVPDFAAAALSPRLHVLAASAGPKRVLLDGAWTLTLLGTGYAALAQQVATTAGVADEWDLRGISSLDGTGAVLLWRAWGHRRPARLQLQPEHEAVFQALANGVGSAPRRRPAASPWQRWVALSTAVADHGLGALALTGQLALDLLGWLRHPGDIAWREISANVYRAGALALPITALVGFLVGLTLSYLTSKQLQAFGADIYVVNILGIAVWRELGPLLAAVLIAGRSGSSMTAQLGVMRVTQELDALSVMGISHSARLVLPKVLALALAMPLVTVWTSIVMLAGGMLAAQLQLGLGVQQFVQALPAAVPASNLVLGIVKSVGFGALIAGVACHFGLRVRPDTESLGAGTTASVVSAITAVIVLDAIFAVLFSDVGL